MLKSLKILRMVMIIAHWINKHKLKSRSETNISKVINLTK